MRCGPAVASALAQALGAAAPAWAHHPGGGGSDEGVGLPWLLLGGVVLILVGIAGWAFFVPQGEDGRDDDDARGSGG